MHVSVDGHLHCFSALTIINSAAVNIEMHVSFQIRIFFKYMPRSGIAHSYGSSTFGFLRPLHTILLWSGGSVGKESACTAWIPRFDPWVGKISWRRECQPTPVFLPGEFHGQRSLMSYSSWDCRVRHDWATNTILFSKVAVPTYIPTNSVEESLFLHTLSSMCYL